MVPQVKQGAIEDEDQFTKFLKKPFFDGQGPTRLEVTFIASNHHSEKPNLLDWQFIEWSNDNQVSSFQLKFDRPELVSMQVPQDMIEIKFNDASAFLSKKGYLVENGLKLERVIRPQVSIGSLSDAIETSGDTIVQTLPWLGGSSIVLESLMSFGLVYLWGLINNLQLLVHLPILSLQFPGLAAMLYELLFEVANFEYVKIEDFVQTVFELNKGQEAVYDQLDRVGISDRDLISGSGLMLPTLLSFFPVFFLSALLWSCKSLGFKICQKIRSGFDKLFFWNFYTRAIIEGCLGMSLLSLLDLEHNDRELSWGHTFSFALSVSLLTMIAFFLLWIRCFLRRQDLKQESIKRRFGGIYDGLVPTQRSLVLVEWFIARRLLFVVSAFYAMESLWISLQTILVASLITLTLLTMKNRYIDRSSQASEIYNEIAQLTIQYHLFGFSDLVRESTVKVKLGSSVALITIAFIFVGFTINITAIVCAARLYCRAKFAQCKLRKFKFNSREVAKKHPMQKTENLVDATKGGSVANQESNPWSRNQNIALDQKLVNPDRNRIELLIGKEDMDPISFRRSKNDLLHSLSSLNSSCVEMEDLDNQDNTCDVTDPQTQPRTIQDSRQNRGINQKESSDEKELQRLTKLHNILYSLQQESDIFKINKKQEADIREPIQPREIDIPVLQTQEEAPMGHLARDANFKKIVVAQAENNESQSFTNIPLSKNQGVGVQRSKDEYREIAKNRIQNALKKVGDIF